MIKQLKYFLDSLNIIVILASGCEYFYAKCVWFPITFLRWKQTKIFSL